MKAWKAFALACGIAAASSATATILPPNDLHLEDSLSLTSGITEAEFNTTLDHVFAIYAPVFAVHNATFKISRNWADSTVNAYAQKLGSTWLISMFGGLARRPEVTVDGFALVACHEVGHHLGGFPTYFLSDMASEGQADYFATHACAKMIWGTQLEENAKYRDLASVNVKATCDASVADIDDQNLCYRATMGGESLARLLGALGGTPNVDIMTPSTVVVRSTQTSHPKAQCRLDTYLAGSVCGVEFPSSEIPNSWETARAVSCSTAAGSTSGFRPLCWFKPADGER